jgi:hypothetical protein
METTTEDIEGQTPDGSLGPFVATLTWKTFSDPRRTWVDAEGVEHVRGQISTGVVAGDMEATASNDFNSDLDPRTGTGRVFGSYQFVTANETWDGNFGGRIAHGSIGTFDGMSNRGGKLAGTFDQIAEGTYRCEWFLMGVVNGGSDTAAHVS